jgi:hypothetical protein
MLRHTGDVQSVDTTGGSEQGCRVASTAPHTMAYKTRPRLKRPYQHTMYTKREMIATVP